MLTSHPQIGKTHDLFDCIAVWSDLAHGMCPYGYLEVSNNMNTKLMSFTNHCWIDLHEHVELFWPVL